MADPHRPQPRRQPLPRPLDETTTLAALHTTEQLVEGRDELSRVLEGVRQLPDDRREALIMRFALGMDNREIARALGRSDGATKVLIHRAIKQLEERVGHRGEGSTVEAKHGRTDSGAGSQPAAR
jgi:RNA polymerase sigma-70 factor (ECF subfamily)